MTRLRTIELDAGTSVLNMQAFAESLNAEKLKFDAYEAQIALEAAKAMGSFSAQLAAGAMSAAKVGADLGARVNFSHAENFETIRRYD